ncbi:hypothetical protein HY546_00105 [archaeon]|nr:hypothetical protein [archaeon]
MKKFALAQARWFILFFLLDNRCFSEHGHQVTEETVLRKVSYEFEDRSKKLVRKALHQLIADGLVSSKKKHYGLHIWITRARLDEVRNILA